jgi:uncharacterized protein
MQREKVEIYSTKKGMIAIESPIKNEILKMLRERELTFEELTGLCKKAKSTMSVHLNDLMDMGLVYRRVDDNDRRKKYFGLNTDLIVSSRAPVSEHYDLILKSIPDALGDRYAFLKSLFHLVRCGMESYGVDTSPALKKMGRDVGKVLSAQFHSTDMENLLGEIAVFWKEQGLGTVSPVKGDVPAFIVDDCFDCSTMPDIGRTQCSMDEGIVEAIIEEKLKVRCSVEEVECYGTGYHHCKFIVKIF